jgi:hypothetical protein
MWGFLKFVFILGSLGGPWLTLTTIIVLWSPCRFPILGQLLIRRLNALDFRNFRDMHDEAVHPALTRIYTLTLPLTPSPRHHAVFKAPHPTRLHLSSHSGSARLSYRAPHPLRSYPPGPTRTCAQCHIWPGRLNWIVLYQHHSGRKGVRRLNRHGQVIV